MLATPAPFTFREGSNDEEIFRVVCAQNEYRLPDAFAPDDIVVDIGMHIGSFCYAAALRGARRIYGFEPDHDNYRCAIHNLRLFADYVHAYPKAVWRSDRIERTLRLTRSTEGNQAGGGVLYPDRLAGEEVEAIALDDLLRQITDSGRRRVACLKIDCEGAEFPILLTSRHLHLVDYICGEFHEFRSGIAEHARVAGVERFSIAELAQTLNQNGFTVFSERYEETHLGLFFAYNSSDRYLMEISSAACAICSSCARKLPQGHSIDFERGWHGGCLPRRFGRSTRRTRRPCASSRA